MAEIHEPIYQRLKETARSQSLVVYSELAEMAGLNMSLDKDRGTLGDILGAISQLEHQQGHPMLSVVSVLKDTQMPSKGFFDWARQLGKLQGDTEMEELEFFAHELQAAYDYWTAN